MTRYFIKNIIPAWFILIFLLPGGLSADDAGSGYPAQAGKRSYLVGFAQDTLGNDWRQAQVRELEQALARYPFIRFISTDGQGRTAKQIMDIETLVAQGVDLLVTSPRDFKALSPVISDVYRRGIPVVLLTRRIASDDYSIFLGADDRQIARKAADYLAARLRGKGRILMLKGVPTATTAINRTQGFQDQIDAHSGLQIVAVKTANYQHADAIQAMEEVLAAGVQFDAIYAQSDSMATGARMVLERHGIDPATVPIVGIDYMTESREAIRMGKQAISFTYPTGGREGAEYIARLLQGESVPKEVTLESIMISRDNVEHVAPLF